MSCAFPARATQQEECPTPPTQPQTKGCAEAPIPRIAGDVNPVELGVQWSKAELVSGMFLATIGLAGGVGIVFSKRYLEVGYRTGAGPRLVGGEEAAFFGAALIVLFAPMEGYFLYRLIASRGR